MKQQAYDGRVLRERRLEMGLTPIEVFGKTRIPVEYIEALECGMLQGMPASCYTVGFLRSYCLFLGLNPEPLIAAYQASVRPSHRVLFERTVDFCDGLSHRRLADILTWAAVCGFLALGWFTYNVVVQPQAEVTDNRVEAVEMIVPPSPPNLDQ